MGKRYSKYSYLTTSKEFQEIHNGDTKNPDEFLIWKSFKEGDESAFVYIYNLYYKVLLNLGIQYTRHKDLIKDCIQDLFIEIRTNRKRLADVKCIKSYLMVSFRRKLLNYLSLEDKTYNRNMTIAKDMFEVHLSPEDAIIGKEFTKFQLDKLEKAFNELSKKELEAIYYFYYEDLSYKEISELFNYAQVKTARNLIYMALDKLRSHIIPKSTETGFD